MCLFQSTHYVGHYFHTDRESGEVIELNCPSIVDEKIWNKVQEKVKGSKERHKQIAKTKNSYLIRHLLYCDHCGSPIHERMQEKNHTTLYLLSKKKEGLDEGKTSRRTEVS